MSKSNRDPFDELAENMVGWVFSLLWGAVAGIVTLGVKAFQRSPEDQLRQLGQPGQWGEMLDVAQCPDCRAANDAHAQFCHFCGSQLNASVQARRRGLWHRRR